MMMIPKRPWRVVWNGNVGCPEILDADGNRVHVDCTADGDVAEFVVSLVNRYAPSDQSENDE